MLEAREQPYVEDIPVPAGFQLDGRKSKHTFTAGRRQVSHVYEGDEVIQSVKNFYVHHMPLTGWEQLNDVLEKDVYVLNYKKGMERCDIRIEKTPSGWLGPISTVRVTIRPVDAQPFVTPTNEYAP